MTQSRQKSGFQLQLQCKILQITFDIVPLNTRLIGLVGRVFASGPGGLDSISGRIIPKTLKWYLIPPCLTLSNIRYVSRVKWSNLGSSSYWKGSLLVTLDYGHQLCFTSQWICTNLFLYFRCIFAFFKIKSYNRPKILLIFLYPQS